MLLICVTKSPLGTELPVPRYFAATCRDHVVLIATSFRADVSRCVDCTVIEGQPSEETAIRLRHPLFSVHLCDARGVLEIKRSAGFGLPLYFHVTSRGEFFASTHISLLRAVGVPILENDKVLPELFLYRCVMPPRTLFRNIERVFHGGSLRVSLSASGCIIEDHSMPSWLSGETAREEKWAGGDHAKHLAAILREGISSLRPCAPRVRLLMSGGIDSTVTALLGREELGINETFATSYPFEDEALDMERRYASSAARALGFNHHHDVGTCSAYRRSLIEGIACAEEPVHHLQVPCMHMLFPRRQYNDTHVIVQGLGAGGIFGNFRNHLYLLGKSRYRLLSCGPCRAGIRGIALLTGRGRILADKLAVMVNHEPLTSLDNPLWRWHQYGDREWANRHLECDFSALVAQHLGVLGQTRHATLYDTWAQYSLIGDEDVTLSITAKVLSALGYHLYSPFYEEEILAATTKIPWEWKMHYPENRLRKEVAATIGVPAFIRNRRKTGFGVKRSDWALPGGVLEPLVALAAKVWDIDEIRATQQSRPSMAMTFWILINHAIWRRLVIDGEPKEKLLEELDASEAQFALRDCATSMRTNG